MKRILSICLSVCILLGSFSLDVFASDSAVATGSSKSRIQTYLNMAAGKATTDETLANMTFTKDQLLFLGVYSTNFFVPFGTELGVAASNSESTDDSMTALKSGLQKGLKFSDTYAQTFAENIVGLARGNVQKLKVGYSKEYGATPEGVKDVNYYEFLSYMLSGTNSKSSSVRDMLGADVVTKAVAGNWNYAYFGYDKGGTFTPVFDCSLVASKSTPSQVAFLKCLESVDPKNGFGFSAFDLTSKDMEGGTDVKELTGSDALRSSILGMDLMVDCFGDILTSSLQHQTVIVPGCMNPYMWVSVNQNGSDRLKPGEAYQAINVASMAACDSKDANTKLYNKVSVGEYTQGAGGKAEKSGTTIGTEVLFGKNNEISKATASLTGVNTAQAKEGLQLLSNAVKYLVAYSDAVAGGSNLTVKFQDNQWVVSGSYIELSGLNGDKLKESFGADASKTANREKHINYLSTNHTYKVLRDQYSYKAVSRDELVSSFNVIRDNANKIVTNNPGVKVDQSTEGDTKVTVREIVPNYTKLLSQINSMFGGPSLTKYKANERALSAFKGEPNTSSGVDLDRKMPGKTSNFMKNYKAAIKEYTGKKTHGSLGSKFGNAARVPVNTKTIATLEAVPVLDTTYMIDNLGTYHFDEGGQDVEYNSMVVTNYINDNGTTKNDATYNWVYGSNTFAAGYSNILDAKIAVNMELSDATAVSLYTSYLVSALYEEGAKAETIGALGYRMNGTQFPAIPSEPLNISAEAKSDMMLTNIRDWLYYLLHPTEGLNYFRTWLTNKLNAFLVGIHNDMNGTFGVGITTGTSTYRNSFGYVTTPDLSEIEWTNSLIGIYNTSIPFLIVVMLILMLFAYVTGILSLQKSFFGFLLFVVFLFTPVNLINGVVSVSNEVSSRIYGEKFTYWALVQQETYSNAIEEASSGDSYSNYLRTLYDTNSQTYSNQGSESIVLKWQAPKKMASLMLSKKDSEKVDSLKSGSEKLLKGFLGTQYTGESYTGDPESVYMYRSYLDISNFSQYMYRGLSNGTGNAVRNCTKNITNDISSNWNNGVKEHTQTLRDTYMKDRKAGYTPLNGDGTNTVDGTLRVTVPMSSRIVNDALASRDKIKDLSINDYVGINQDFFKFSIPVFNKNESALPLKETLVENATESTDADWLKQQLDKYTNEDLIGLAAYGVFSESPFYYFSWDLYDMGLVPSAGSKEGFKSLLLGEDNAGFFYNTQGNNELRDFMDMKSLFTYIIPYMRQCNDIVREWDNTYGIFTYEGVPSEEGHWNDPEIKDNKELRQKYWHNLNVARLYGMYCPWVDIMYDCSYAKSEKVKAQGETYIVEDPINPYCYPESRPMVFSKSEMLDYGLSNADLTKVEKKIIKCEEGIQERMFELLNYHNFNDVTLNTAAAMNCTFEFNQTFSEMGLFNNNNNIYPQTFELGDFSYDAFLRFILSNTTGESMVDKNSDFYSTVVKKSSTITAIMLIILDIISIYVLPAFKIFFIIAIFLLSILIILSTAFRVDTEQKFITKVISGLVKPMLQFLGITISFSFLVSLFMGSGNKGVTQTTDVSISMGDPTTVMIAVSALSIGVLVLYGKVIIVVCKMLIKEGKLVANFVGGVIGEVGHSIQKGFNRIAGGKSVVGGSGTSTGVSSGSSSSEGSGATNGASTRATGRAIANASSVKEREEREVRQNDVKRRPIKETNKSDGAKEPNKTSDINNATRSGISKIARANKNKVKDSGRRRR